MKTIIFLSQNLSYGGAYKIMIRIANYLAECGKYKIRILNLGVNKNYYKLDESIIVDNYIISSKGGLFKIFSAIYRLIHTYGYVKKHRGNLVVAFDNTEKLIAVLISKVIKGCKCLISERKDPYSYSSKKRNMYWRYDHSDGIVFQTEGAKSYFSLDAQNKSTVIPNFIESPQVKTKSFAEREDSICFSGRFDLNAKNPFLLLEAFKLIYEKYPKLELVMYGDGNKSYGDKETVRKEAERLGISERVKLPGVVFPVTNELVKSKIYVITSNYEGIPNSLLEAMACGLPVISTDCSPGGARLLLTNLKNGIIIPRNDKKNLASSITYFLDNPQIADQMGQEAKNVLEDYHPSKILQLWEKYIDSIICKER